MANPEHLEILRQGAGIWNKWRYDNRSINPDLRSANLPYADLQYFNFEDADLRNADLREASLQGTNFRDATLANTNLYFADLSGARLIGTNLFQADLSAADIGNAIIIHANLSFVKLQSASLVFATIRDCDLTRADFTNCALGGTVIAECDLTRAEHLEDISHISPCPLSLDTIYKSGGKIPESFLRGCGVPETFIIYAKSLVDNPIEYYSCFISFTEKDDAFSERLYNDMQTKGVRCWRWKEDAKWGGVLRQEIDEAVRYYDKLVVICSKDSLNAPAVIEEIKRALNKEDSQKKNVLFPIMIDDYLLDEWDHYLKVRITDKIVGNFCDWNGNPEKYRKSVERLVKDLNRPSAAR